METNNDKKITDKSGEISRPVNLWAACSGYQVTFLKNRLYDRVAPEIRLHYGPGCAACLLSPSFIDRLTAYSRRVNVIIATYRDLLNIAGTNSTLEKARTNGADIRVVSKIWDVLLLAKKNRRKRIVFPAFGFEAAASSTAAAILQAKVAGLFNFQVLMGHKRMKACMETVLQNRYFPVDGIITSGRVAAVTGTDYFRTISEKYQIPQVISDYSPDGFLNAVETLAREAAGGKTGVLNLFPEAVSAEGNRKSHQLLEEVFEPATAFCNGLGDVAEAGFAIKKEYRMFDAEKVFFDEEVTEPEKPENECVCGQILQGTLTPSACPFFGKTCNPLSPKSACMGSEEGPCRTEFLFGKRQLS